MVSFSIFATLAMALVATAAPAPALVPAPIEVSASIPDGQVSANWVGSVSQYEPGLGSCGQHSTFSDFVVAMSPFYVGPTARISSCGRVVRIVNGEKHVDVEVVDVCKDCKDADLKISPAAFKALLGDSNASRAIVGWGFM